VPRTSTPAPKQAAASTGPGAAPSRDRPLLRLHELDVSYAGAIRALRQVSLSVPDGAVVAVLGGNGAGKSTLLRAISGTLRFSQGAIDAGEIEFAGRRLDGADPADIVRAGVVQVPEGRRIFAELTVEENLRAGGLAVGRRERAATRDRVYDLFPVLRERRRQRAGLLSGGEQQMVAIGRALMARPRLLLLDEPSLGLAPRVVEQIGEVIAEINRQGTAVVLVEQNAAMALRVADLGFVLELGRVSLFGPARELAENDEVRDRYLGVAPSTGPEPAEPESAQAAAAEAAAAQAETAEPGAGQAAAAESRPSASAKPRKAAESRTSAASALPRAVAHELIVEDLTVRFGGITALSEVSFTVAPGSVHALIGPNGAGKSSTLNVLSGVYQAKSGSVRYGGHELTRLRPDQIARLGVSRTFQNISLSATSTVEDNLLLARHRLTRAGFLSAGLTLPRARRERAEHGRRVRLVAELLDLVEYLDQPVHILPYGIRKRIELARALCAEPGLLLLDEPVAGMNGDETAAMARAVAAVRRELGVSILVVEHDMAFVMNIADRLTVLDFGRRIADGTPEEVRRHPDVLRAYLGTTTDSGKTA
jgi:ABC-type branched-subunit amino acid transport system ATPase component